MPSYSAYSSPPSSNQNPSFYRITRYFLFFFFPCWPILRVQRNRRRYSKEYELESFILPSRYLRKTCAQTFAGGNKSCFVDASSSRLRATFNRDTRPFLLRLFRGKRKIAETWNTGFAFSGRPPSPLSQQRFLQHNFSPLRLYSLWRFTWKINSSLFHSQSLSERTREML